MIFFSRLLILFCFINTYSVNAFSSATEIKWKESIDFHKNQFKITDPYVKKIDNKGHGDDSFYGVRNLRVVLHGVLYRGGANNTNNKIKKRANSFPLQEHALINLCKNGFSKAIYLYDSQNQEMTKNVSCTDINNNKNTSEYVQLSAFKKEDMKEILKVIHEHIIAKNQKPIYAHCWNGWHASGLVAALSLIQFCHVSNSKALEYWIKNTDGHSTGYQKVKDQITNYKIQSELEIPKETAKLICPEI